MGRLPKNPKRGVLSKPFSIRLHPDLLDQLNEISEATGTNRNELIGQAVRNFVRTKRKQRKFIQEPLDIEPDRIDEFAQCETCGKTFILPKDRFDRNTNCDECRQKAIGSMFQN